MLYDKKWDVDVVGRALLEAADYIEQHGWCKGTFENDEGQVCVMGAFNAGLSWVQPGERLMHYLQSVGVYGDAPSSLDATLYLPMWNDTTSGLTQTKVIEALRAAAVFK